MDRDWGWDLGRLVLKWAEMGLEQVLGPEQVLVVPAGLRYGAAPAPHCRALSWGWGWFCFPMTPHQPRPHGAALGAPSPRCPHPVLLTRGSGTGNGPGTGNSTGRNPHSCTQHPGPTAAHGVQTCRGSGGRPGVGAPGREEVGPAVAMSGSFLPGMLHPACAPLPCRPPHQGHRHQAGSAATAILLC